MEHRVGGRRWRGGRAGLPAALCVALLLVAAPAEAQSLSAEPAPALTEADAHAPPHYERRLYVGMWTSHLKRDVLAIDTNWAVGLSARGFFGATFLNSFGRRAFTGGLQRTLLSTGPHHVRAALGYRLGFVTGYDRRFMRIAEKTPVLPLIQPFVEVDVVHVGFELSYTVVVLSVATSYRF
jgi:hypothetical protein